MERHIGIDLGTTNSTISVAHLTTKGDVETTTLEVIQTNEQGTALVTDYTLPSILYFNDENHRYVGKYAKRMNGFFPQSVIKNVKRFMGRDEGWVIGGKSIRPEEVSASILSTLRATAKDHYINEEIESVVITIPANFDFQQQQATKNAAILSGFNADKIHMIPEPTAALIDFLNEEDKVDIDSRRIDFRSGKKNLMVFDLGGGTCDVSILQVETNKLGKLNIQEVSISQYTELGGTDFDTAAVVSLLRMFAQQTGLTTKKIQAQYGKEVVAQLLANLYDIAENAKMKFSTTIESRLRTESKDYFVEKDSYDSIVFLEAIDSNLPDEFASNFSFTKKEYDEMIRSLLYADEGSSKNIEAPILNALESSIIGKLSLEDIDAVFLVGGMTFYPTVQERIYDIFKRRIKPIRSMNPMKSVSRGAAIYHYRIHDISLKNNDEYVSPEVAPSLVRDQGLIGNTVPSNIFVDVISGDPVILLQKGTKLPFERQIEDSFIVMGSEEHKEVLGMQLDLFSAPFAKSIHTRKLKSAKINFKQPVKTGSKLVLKVSCNEEREVSVKAWLKDDETEMLDVNIGSHEFTQEEIESFQKNHVSLNTLQE
ncbi:Hsp70 family protein [Paenibacillus sp. NPDC057934]|uniref:Hsp70 family protein n=1 Tax=Paenibacillus sp. NPDC057934 TaxID=3346282 RepID=UPI0036DC584A